jgi:membrane protease YdiL (CAAX protease family)
MFKEQIVADLYKFSKYLLGSFFVIITTFIGQVPMMIAIKYKIEKEGLVFPENQDALMNFFEPNLSLFYLLLPFVFSFIGIYLIARYLHNQSLLSLVTNRVKMDWKRVFFSFTIWSLFTIVSTVVSFYLYPEDFEINFKLIPFLVLVLISVLLIPIQTTVEELVFRGYLMQGFFELSGNKWFPLLMTSVIFGLMHLSNPEVAKLGPLILVYYIGTGLFLGMITIMDKGMELALGFHAANNLIGALLVTTDWTVFQTYSILKDLSQPDAGIDIILPVMVIYPLLLFIFGCKYNWFNWEKKVLEK